MRSLVTAGKHDNNTRAIARQLLSKWVPATMSMHAAVKVLLDYNNGNRVFCGQSQLLGSSVQEAVKRSLYMCCSTVIFEVCNSVRLL
jgi:hypothetical protein